MTTRVVVIGLDGAARHILDPLLADGHMPRLAALLERACRGTLVSTVPTYTPPAWSSAATGVNPGRHGIYGFYGSNAQSERQELMHSGKLKTAAFWEMANAQGARTGVHHLPLTYPPQDVDGWMISGMLTPGFGEQPRGFARPTELEPKIRAWAPGYAIDVSANWEADYKDAGLCDRVCAALAQRATVLERLLELEPCDIVFSVLESPDRLMHVYYRYMDPADEMYSSAEAERLRPAVSRCFEALDAIAGILIDYAGAEGGVIVCSDHGFTSWEVSVHTNALLERWGYLKLKRSARLMQSAPARKAVPLAKRVLPARIAREAKGRTFAAIDWGHTRAFASPIPQQGIFFNVAGRERFGIVPRARMGALKDDLQARFESLRGPDGAPVTDRVYRSEEVFEGGHLEGAPDLMPVLRDHRFELDDEIFHRDPFTDLRHLPRGVHHPDGIGVLAGPGVRAGAELRGSILDVTPTLLYMAGLAVPDDLDGRVLTDAFTEEQLKDRPIRTTAPLSSGLREEASPYTEEEEAAIEESLRGLGYL
ncbi:MAG: alkaline phosphatase family protein [Actinomycetota bacterium]